ncbi:hypothetical protein PV691_37570 [Streptomyces sp. AK08-01A]|nr:hypothetical protein [Streptomyces sp. AK08-01A]
MGSARSGEPAHSVSFGNRLAAACRAVVKRPWLLLSWLALAALVVCAQHFVPQPWSAVVYPVALVAALGLANRAKSGN